MILGCIADDLTGASDLAGVLVAAGMRTMQTIGVPASAIEPDLDAVVVSLKSRTAPVAEAVNDSIAALHWLRTSGCNRIFFKYCSTFDSTAAGNIGPVLDALAQAMGTTFSIACPAFPANKRTVYQGHLFVGDRLLNESGMENHPLTPMNDADLVRVLQSQTATKVGLIPLAEIRADDIGRRAQALIAGGTGIAIGDAVNGADLRALGRYCATLPLSSGASGLAEGIARALMGDDAAGAPATLPRVRGRCAVLAGSCSLATRRQVEVMAATCPSYRITLSEGCLPGTIAAEACTWYDAQNGDTPVLIYCTADPEDVARQRAIFSDASAVLERILADVASHMVASGQRALVVAGGETSGAVVQRLGIDRLRIGPEIDPGVPWTIGSGKDGSEMLLALKSGNFGAEDFMLKAWDLLP